MKRLLSIALALMMILSAVTVFSLTTAAADGFKEGDVLWFKVENPANWTQDAVLYANFTAYSRADNGGNSVVIADADPTKYHPVQGVTYDEERGLYCYTVTAADAGATAMRFWRGNAEKLWNSTVTLTAEEYAKGNNTAVVTDWDDTGYLTATKKYDIRAKLNLSKTTGKVGDSIEIRATYNVPDILTVTTQIFIDDKKVCDDEVYTFTPDADGTYAIRAELSAARFDDDTEIVHETLTGSVTIGSSPIANMTGVGLYAHASRGSKDQEGWVKWRQAGDDYYLFLPVSVKENEPVELFNAYNEEVTLDSTAIPANSIVDFKPEAGKGYLFRQGRTTRTVKFMYSTAEAALFVNNLDDFDGMDFFEYLKADKSHYVSGAGIIANDNGALTNAPVKKMKGRGNTSWNADKKGFNVTFTEAISVAGMPKNKKYSLISNFQDASMLRNRILYDMSDAVGVPYASDSRFVDLYTNGVYQGTYQMCEKIEVGKNSMMPDIAADDYLNKDTGGVKSDFAFVAEIDPSPSDDDFHFSVQNGCNLTIKSPELDSTDANLATVRGNIKKKFNTMWDKLTGNAADLNDYIDLDSLAKVYLINELGKNWDSGAASFFLTYKADATGKFKFFASPVWDYDNSLGNARGVESDLRRLNCTDYELPSGWWSSIKGGYGGPNFLATAAKQSVVMNKVYTVWFEDFLPAIDTLTKTGVNTGELYSMDVYANIVRGSAAMNYKIWELVTNASWVADHSSVKQYRAAYTKNQYGQVTAVAVTQDSKATAYEQYTYDGQVYYLLDWTTSRAAWISSQYIANYKPEVPVVPPTEPDTQEPTQPEPAIVPYPYPVIGSDNTFAEWFFDDTGKTEGDKLTEYGSSDGYAATFGSGTLTMSIDGSKGRALEWSAAEYGPSGKSLVPIMGAGKKNMWGSPYIQLAVSTKGYENIKLTMLMAASNKAPASWKLQYSTDGTTFTDTDTVINFSAENRKLLTAYLNQTALPAAAADADTLLLKLVPVSMTTVGGGNALETNTDGEIAMNYLFVEGTKKAVDPADRLLGDADADGAVTILDATRIQRYLADLATDAEIDKEAADVTGDGVDILDATMIQRWLAELEVAYPINQPIAQA